MVLLASADPRIASACGSGARNASFDNPYRHSEIMNTIISRIDMMAMNYDIVSLGQQNMNKEEQKFSSRASDSSPLFSNLYSLYNDLLSSSGSA